MAHKDQGEAILAAELKIDIRGVPLCEVVINGHGSGSSGAECGQAIGFCGRRPSEAEF
jgi:hypothetical protein